MVETGLMQKLKNDWLKTSSAKCEDYSPTHVVFGLMNTTLIFIFLLAGMVIAVIVLLGELYVNKQAH